MIERDLIDTEFTATNAIQRDLKVGLERDLKVGPVSMLVFQYL